MNRSAKKKKFSLIYQWYLLEILLEDFFEILKYLIFLFLIFSRETCDSQWDSRPRKNINISSKNLAKKFFLDDISLISLWDVSLENLNETLGWEINMGKLFSQRKIVNISEFFSKIANFTTIKNNKKFFFPYYLPGNPQLSNVTSSCS